MKPLQHCRLYAFVDTGFLRGRSPESLAQALCDGGADLIQLRAKGCSLEAVRGMAEPILPVTRRAGVGLVINDHPTLARELGAEFCHLGQNDLFGAGHTRISQLPLGQSAAGAPPLRFGLSSAAPEQATRAMAAGADYLGVGPVFPTGTKPDAKAVTISYVRWAAAHLTVPWFAIGGITLENLDSVLAAGARGICVVSAILNADDVAAACRQFKDRLPPCDSAG
jgi:thiamine-phosphate pyrophosphorylase